MRIVLFLLPLVLGIYCLVEAISSRDDEVRNLSRVWWILLILFFPFVGSVAWLAAGRPVRTPRRLGPHERSTSEFPEYDRPGRFAASDPVADEEFLAKVRERAEEQRRQTRERKAAEREAAERQEEARRQAEESAAAGPADTDADQDGPQG